MYNFCPKPTPLYLPLQNILLNVNSSYILPIYYLLFLSKIAFETKNVPLTQKRQSLFT